MAVDGIVVSVMSGNPAGVAVLKVSGYLDTTTAEELEQTLGLDGVVLEMNFGGQIPQDQMLNSLRILGQEVIPQFN